MSEVTVYVLVTHDNRFVDVYATREEAMADARPGGAIEECLLNEDPGSASVDSHARAIPKEAGGV